MKKTIQTLLLVLPLLSFNQPDKHKIFGIDLEMGWTSLTGYQNLSYWIIDNDKSNKDPFVMTDFNYYHKNIDSDFMQLGFDELLLGFPRGKYAELPELKPVLFLSRISYKDSISYSKKSTIDISKALTLLTRDFGQPTLKTINKKFSVYSWNGVYYQMVLTCRADELTTTLIYNKK